MLSMLTAVLWYLCNICGLINTQRWKSPAGIRAISTCSACSGLTFIWVQWRSRKHDFLRSQHVTVLCWQAVWGSLPVPVPGFQKLLATDMLMQACGDIHGEDRVKQHFVGMAFFSRARTTGKMGEVVDKLKANLRYLACHSSTILYNPLLHIWCCGWSHCVHQDTVILIAYTKVLLYSLHTPRCCYTQ